MSFFPNADLGKVWRGRKKKKKSLNAREIAKSIVKGLSCVFFRNFC